MKGMKNPIKDKKEDEWNSWRVYRGGSWFNFPKYIRVSHSRDYTPTYRSNDFGFRIARNQK